MALQLAPGDVYGKFRIVKEVRSSSTARVFMVEEPGVDRPLDLKLSREPVASEEAARRALREIAVLEGITNDHVVDVRASGLGPEEHWFILMEHLEGAQLDQWHDFDRPLPGADAVGIVHQACLGLAEVHAAEIVHRDVRPQNLWVDPDRMVKILDFGAARSWANTSESADDVTTGLRLHGAPPYTAPEQLWSRSLTPATDVYALGTILYELLSGHSPFFPAESWSAGRARLASDPGAWMRAHAQSPVVPVAEHEACATLPAKLVQTLHACLDKDPKQRPPDAGELANRLGWVLHHELGVARAATLKVVREDGAVRYHLLLPGSHPVTLDAERGILLDGDDSRALGLLEWSGAPHVAEVRPLAGAQSWSVAGEPVRGRAALPAASVLELGRVRVQITYPA